MEGIQSSPSVVDSLVIIGSRDANVYALHAKTGKKIWMQSFGGSWMPSSFAIANKTAYTGSSDGKGFFSLDLKNGKINYSTNTSLFTFSTPAIANQLAFIGVMNGSLLAIDLTSGTIKGKFDTSGRLLNPLKAIKIDGTLNDEVFKDLNGSDYSLNVEYVRRIMTAGSILSTPVLDKNVVYFGSTDSCFYAVQDAGGCKPKFKVSTSMVKSINPVGTMLDTVLYVSNMSDCIDSVKIYAAPSSYLAANSFEIKPSSFNTLPNDSVRVHIKVNTTGLKPGKTYSFKIISQSKTNEYYLFNTDISLRTTSPTTAISQIDEKTADVIYPNPFSDFTVLKYALDKDCPVDVRIYNSAGQMMTVLVDQNQKIGEYSVTWDGKNCEGAKLNPGIYICTIRKGKSLTSKEILLAD
jgi:outer membrane protein assembly factor BamB